MIRKAFDRGALLDLTVDDVARLLKGIHDSALPGKSLHTAG